MNNINPELLINVFKFAGKDAKYPIELTCKLWHDTIHPSISVLMLSETGIEWVKKCKAKPMNILLVALRHKNAVLIEDYKDYIDIKNMDIHGRIVTYNSKELIDYVWARHSKEECKLFLNEAVYWGNIEMAEYIYRTYLTDYDECMKCLIYLATSRGHVDMVEWLNGMMRELCERKGTEYVPFYNLTGAYESDSVELFKKCLSINNSEDRDSLKMGGYCVGSIQNNAINILNYVINTLMPNSIHPSIRAIPKSRVLYEFLLENVDYNKNEVVLKWILESAANKSATIKGFPPLQTILSRGSLVTDAFPIEVALQYPIGTLEWISDNFEKPFPLSYYDEPIEINEDRIRVLLRQYRYVEWSESQGLWELIFKSKFTSIYLPYIDHSNPEGGPFPDTALKVIDAHKYAEPLELEYVEAKKYDKYVKSIGRPEWSRFDKKEILDKYKRLGLDFCYNWFNMKSST